MPTSISASTFADEFDLADWRYLLGAIEATFVIDPSDDGPAFAAAAQFVVDIARMADTADHHPDVNLRYPGVVHVFLTTHGSGGLTDLDVDLARRISLEAAARGLRSEPVAAQRIEIAIDALDIDRVRPFWLAVLGYRERPTSPDGIVYDIADRRRLGPGFWFQQMDEPRTERNRIHLDVSVPHDEADARVEAALAAGGVLLTDRYARAFWVLADPEGNEACVCTWQDRD